MGQSLSGRRPVALTGFAPPGVISVSVQIVPVLPWVTTQVTQWTQPLEHIEAMLAGQSATEIASTAPTVNVVRVRYRTEPRAHDG